MSGNEVVIHVKAEDDSGPVMAKTRENLKGVGDEAAKAKEKVKEFGDETAKAKDKTQGLGEKTRELGQHAGMVESEIKRLTAEIRALNLEMNRTGNTELFKQLEPKRVELAKFERTAKDLARDLKEAAAAGTNLPSVLNAIGTGSAGAKMQIGRLRSEIVELRKDLRAGGGISVLGEMDSKHSEIAKLERVVAGLAGQAKDAIRAAGPQMTDTLSASMDLTGMGFKGPLIGALVAAAAAAAPAVGAMIGGAVIGAVGLGGIVGGIVAAAHDPRVKAAGTDFAQSAFGEMKTSIGPAFVEPTIGALGILKSAVKDLFSESQLGPSMRALANEVQPLAAGLGGMLRELVPGLTAAFKAALPVLQAFADALPQLGKDLSRMFKAMSDDPDGAILGMRLLMEVIGDVAIAFGETIGFLSRVYTSAVKITVTATDLLLGVMKVIGVLNPLIAGPIIGYLQDVHDHAVGQMDAMNGAKNATGEYGGALGEMGGEAQKAANDLKALAAAIDDVFNRQMNIDEATLRWQKGLLDLKKELSDGMRTMSLYTEEGLKNRGAMLNQIEAAERLRDATFKQTGDLDSANLAFQKNIQALYDMARAAGFSKTELDALFGPYFSGTATAKLNFEFPGLFEGLEGMKRMAAFAGQAQGWSSQRNTERQGHASGGPWGGGWGSMNEHGGEAVKLPNGSTVIPAGATQQMMSGGGSSPTIIVQLIDPMTGAVTRQKMIDDALTRGVPQSSVAGAYP